MHVLPIPRCREEEHAVGHTAHAFGSLVLVCVPVQVIFLPQRPVAAPGNTLLEQLIYPAVMPEEGSALDLQHLAHLLQQVGLIDLLQRVQGDWRLNQNWQGMESAFHASCGCHCPISQRALSRHGPCLVETG